jgi:predicted 3-demethylubiquinone-9 3-methyltransferase (glyoxalase superfamily)
MAGKIVPHLWFDGAVEEAAETYVSLIPGSSVGRVARYGKAGFEIHGQPEGRAMSVEFDLGGSAMVGINGGPHYRPTPAVSYFVTLEEAAEVDRFWEGLVDGGRALMPLDTYDWSPRYGWLQDCWGVSWQVAQGSRADVGGQAVVPALLFTGAVAGEAEPAMRHYTEILPDSGIEGILRHDGSGPDAAGGVKHAQFRLFGQTFMAIDSALDHGFGFTEANSFMVMCEDQAEIDRYFSALSAVPEAERCGWLKDRFGVSWQIVPRSLPEMMRDPEAAERVVGAFMGMGKLDIAALERARAG